jgi:hypothetical protein
MGCVGKGCLTLTGLLIFLAIALVAGAFWGLHYLRSYSSAEPLPLPTVETTTSVEEESSEAPPAALPTPSPLTTAAPVTEPTPAIQVSPPPPATPPVSRDWKSFEKAAKHGQPASVQLSADEINGLIAASHARGKVFVAIENNVGRVQVSMQLKGVYMLNGRYLNGTATVEASPDGDPAKARISNIVLGGQSVPDSMLDQAFFGWPSIRTTVRNWLSERNITTFRIENNQVFGSTSGGR